MKYSIKIETPTDMYIIPLRNITSIKVPTDLKKSTQLAIHFVSGEINYFSFTSNDCVYYLDGGTPVSMNEENLDDIAADIAGRIW